MQLLNIALVVLCWAGVAHAQAVKDDCSDGQPACGANLVCQEDTCRAEIGQTCTASSTDECVDTAADCPSGASPVCTCPDDTAANDDNTKCLKNAEQPCNAAADCLAGATCEGDPKQCTCPNGANVAKTKCRAKIGEACTASSTDECVVTAADCPSGASPVCTCPADKTANTDNTKCVMKAGESCSVVADCLSGATCEGDPKKCTCPNGANDDNTKCLEKIGDACDAQKVCIDNAECSSDKCACKTDFLPSYDMKMCAKEPGKSCDASNPCGENAECKSDECACKEHFTFKEGERCGKAVDGACTENKECVTNAECKDNKCKCMTDYTQAGDFCSGASAVMASLTLLLAALVASLRM